MSAAELPTFRRAAAGDAVAVARAAFLANERVDMQTVSAQLGVARSTLHRWVGTREDLLDRILGELAAEFYVQARAEVSGEGDELIRDAAKRIIGITSRFEPALGFVEREPGLAIRLFVGQNSSVRRQLLKDLRALLAEMLPDEATALDEFAVTLVHVGTAMQWTALVAGEQPNTEQFGQIATALLLGARAGLLSSG